MKAMNVRKVPKEGYTSIEENNLAKKRAERVLKRVKAEDKKSDKTIFSGKVNGKFTEVAIKGENSEEKFRRLCLAQNWDFANFVRR